MPVIGTFNALIAVLCVWALTTGRLSWQIAKMPIAIVVVSCMAFLLPTVLTWTIGTPAPMPNALVLALVQMALIVVSLSITLGAVKLGIG